MIFRLAAVTHVASNRKMSTRLQHIVSTFVSLNPKKYVIGLKVI